MRYLSTRNKITLKTLSEAIQLGLASDGGLFVPESLHKITPQYFPADLSYVEFSEKLLRNFFSGDILETKLGALCKEAFNFPVPLRQLNPNTFMLELFHGPTSSFKDFGARFLAGCLTELSKKQKTTIIVATSGDTGSAVASAFYKKNNINVVILYPDKLITERQEHQITCWDTNVLALAVKGTFDDCQKLVKTAFHHYSTANSINIGRLLPQIIYYAYSSIQFFHRHKVAPGFIVPTGNLGNATAGYYAKAMGFPIREIVLSTNINRSIQDYINLGEFHPRPSLSTLANAMDVGNPSNFERLTHLFNTHADFKKNVIAISATDADIKKTIKDMYEKYKVIVCPHTATACFAREELSDKPWIVVATADPSKFDAVIEPILNIKIPTAPALQELLNKSSHIMEVDNNPVMIQKIIDKYLE
ncbi:MAG TPA: threonine synthase [Gammaproteobacteria bacterium]|nr:threonine synthase [Gammaproteobacteria bacterium]